jgi:hypothetical protein
MGAFLTVSQREKDQVRGIVTEQSGIAMQSQLAKSQGLVLQF